MLVFINKFVLICQHRNSHLHNLNRGRRCSSWQNCSILMFKYRLRSSTRRKKTKCTAGRSLARARPQTLSPCNKEKTPRWHELLTRGVFFTSSFPGSVLLTPAARTTRLCELAHRQTKSRRRHIPGVGSGRDPSALASGCRCPPLHTHCLV